MFGSNIENRYRHDGTFNSVVDQLRALLGTCNITPSELREAAILAATMHEAENIRPLFIVKYDKETARMPVYTNLHDFYAPPTMFGGAPPTMFGGASLDIESTTSGRWKSEVPSKSNTPKETYNCICGSTEHSATCKHYNWKPTPFTEHVFGKVQGIKDYEFRVCKRCGLSDIYIGDSKDACKGTIKLR